jgi:hypothetical protein
MKDETAKKQSYIPAQRAFASSLLKVVFVIIISLNKDHCDRNSDSLSTQHILTTDSESTRRK